MIKVFLGGTCNGSTWRDEIIEYLTEKGIEYFNPVVLDWTESCMIQEIQERKICDFVLYTITPKMAGMYSIAEVVDDSNKRPKKTLLVLLQDDEKTKFTEGQWLSLNAVAKMVVQNGGQVFYHLKTAVLYISNKL